MAPDCAAPAGGWTDQVPYGPEPAGRHDGVRNCREALMSMLRRTRFASLLAITFLLAACGPNTQSPGASTPPDESAGAGASGEPSGEAAAPAGAGAVFVYGLRL